MPAATTERYILSPSAWGAAVEVPVGDVVQAILFSDFGARPGTHYERVSLLPDPLTRAWRVSSRGGIIGQVHAAQRARFPDIERIHAAGVAPTTLAGLRLNPDSGLYDVTLFLPPAALAVPRNGTREASLVLPAGDMYPVNTATGEFSAAELEQRSPGQWIVGLQVVGEVVVVTLDGRALGSLSPAESEAVRTFLEPALADAPGGALSARAHVLDGMVGLDIAAPDSLCSAVQVLPAIAPAADTPVDTPAEAVGEGPEVTEFPDGTWAVTVDREEAVDPADVATPADGARRVSLTPAAPQPEPPSVDFTPTRSWSISAGNYLTEVEKVRLRRQSDQRGREGRHRREG